MTYATCRRTGVVRGFLLFGLLAVAVDAWAGPAAKKGAFLLWPSGALALPTGRFSRVISDISPPKDGQKTGFAATMDGGYCLSDRASVGLSIDYVRFPVKLSDPPTGRKGNTALYLGQIWLRYFIPGGLPRWQPYLVVGGGLGRKRAVYHYDPPVPSGVLGKQMNELEGTVPAAFALNGGVGFMIPLMPRLSISFEPRYEMLFTRGVGRTDKQFLTDGAVVQGKYDTKGNRLIDKSNTGWWEVRAGVAIIIR